jgi:hypothetical protein
MGRPNPSARNRACLAHARAKETSVILYAYPAAVQKIGDRCNHLSATLRAGADCQNQITQRKPSARSDDLAKLAIPFHVLAISALSMYGASSHCEYVVHGCACSCLLFVHFRTDH